MFGRVEKIYILKILKKLEWNHMYYTSYDAFVIAYLCVLVSCGLRMRLNNLILNSRIV